MGTGDSPEMQKMQDEAIRRAQEFNSQHRHLVPNIQSPRLNLPKQNKGGSLLNELLKDKEKTLILLLLVMICEESDDIELLFALLYLLY